MAISVDKFPAVIAGCDNPVVFDMSVDHVIAGSKAELKLLYPFAENLGAVYTFAWGEHEVTMTCVETPDLSGTQFPERAGETMEEWIVMVADAFADNTLLNADFNIEGRYQELMVVLTAKENGSAFSIDFSDTGETVQEYSNVAGVDAATKENHKLGLQVWRRVDAVDTMVYEELAAGRIVDDEMLVSFDISEVLKSDCVSEVTCVIPETFDIIQRREVCPAYFIKYYESYTGNTPSLSLSNWMFSLNGGVPEWKQLPFYTTYDNLWAYLVTQKRYWLTWCDFVKPTDAGSPEKLYVIFPSKPNTSNFVLRITRHFYDDGDEVEDITITHTFYTGEVYELDVSIATLMGTMPYNMSGYDIQLRSSNGSYYSSIFSFQVDPVNPISVRYFVFRNSLGGFETVRFFGAFDQDISMKRTDYEKSALMAFADGYLPAGQIITEVKRTVKLNSGEQSAQYIAWLQDFLMSDQIYEVRDGAWIPVLVRQDKSPTGTDVVETMNITIEVEYIGLDSAYTYDTSKSWSTAGSITDPYS